LLNWLQGLIAAILPAHERAKAGCAYGMMQKTFAPLDGWGVRRVRKEEDGRFRVSLGEWM
jgi:hypothetical protein